ncbi:hypothetical protein JAB6_25500 [Janthinobacterium sp. HH104]|nr:hypothetical protein JAB6_25500 [Janthinobacterium sp. HH104]
MLSVPLRTSPTMLSRLVFMSFSACSNCPVSSLALASICAVKSPSATLRAISTAVRKGRTMPIVNSQAQTTPKPSASTASTSSRLRLVVATASISRAVVSMLARWCSSKSSTIFWYLAAAGTKVFSNTSLAASTCASPFSL